MTTTSGPGLDLKSEAIGLAINLELPLLIVDVQRGGPSTGLPTKTEQSDLLHAMYGRHGEAPLPIIAAKTPSHCFEAAIEAVADRGQVPDAGHPALRRLPRQRRGALAAAGPRRARADRPRLRHRAEPRRRRRHRGRSGRTCATRRRWPGRGRRPGMPGLEHRIGGLEKADGSGNVSYDGVNHERMIQLRAAKVAGIAQDIPPLEVDDPTGRATCSSSAGARPSAPSPPASRRVRARGQKVAQAHLVHLNPFPANLGEVLGRYRPRARPGDQPRPAQPAHPGRVPRRRPVAQQDAGRAVPGGGDRDGHPRPCWEATDDRPPYR